mmetsp:Transcript_42514/g.102407  ORF Transcript_42514/g.102407 Transcript_42514/m.102407 type:complete len:98 (+) Transcript_42514:189-482(+)
MNTTTQPEKKRDSNQDGLRFGFSRGDSTKNDSSSIFQKREPLRPCSIHYYNERKQTSPFPFVRYTSDIRHQARQDKARRHSLTQQTHRENQGQDDGR